MLGLLENLSNATFRFTDPLGNHFRALDGDEVRLRFVGDGLSEERLTSTRRPEQNNTSWRFDVEVLENLRLCERPLDRFLESVFDFIKSTNLVPGNLWNFDINLTQSRWLNVLDGVTEIGHPDFHLFKDFGRNGLFIEVDLWQVSSKCLHGSFTNECGKVCSNETVRVVKHPIDFEVVRNWHLTCVHFHDFLSALTVWDTNLDFSIETATTSERWVECITTVGCTNDDNVVPSLHSVEQCQHLSNNTSFDFATHIFTLWTNRVNLIDENDGRCLFAGFIEDFTELLFRLSVIFGDDFRTVDSLEVSVHFGCNRLGNHGLSCTRWPVKENAFRWVDTKASKQLRMLEWQFDHFANLLQLLTNTTNVLVGDAFRLTNVFVVNRFVLDDDVRIAGDFDNPFWRCLDHSERQCFGKQRHAWNEDSVTGHDRALGETPASEAFDAGTKLDLLLVGHNWRESQFGALFCLSLCNCDTIAKTHTCVLSNDTINSDYVHFGIFWTASPVNGCC